MSQQVAKRLTLLSEHSGHGPTSIYERPHDWFAPMDCTCSEAMDKTTDSEVIGDGRALKREAVGGNNYGREGREAAP